MNLSQMMFYFIYKSKKYLKLNLTIIFISIIFQEGEMNSLHQFYSNNSISEYIKQTLAEGLKP